MPVDPEAIFGMFIGFCLVVVVPLIAILTSHQRKMAELFRGRNNQEQQYNAHLEARLQHMQGEINELRARVAEHVIAIDDQRSLPPKPPTGIQY